VPKQYQKTYRPTRKPPGWAAFLVSFSILLRSGLSHWSSTLGTVAVSSLIALTSEVGIDFINLGLTKSFLIELLHEQLPLPVPCYDLVLVVELTLGPHT